MQGLGLGFAGFQKIKFFLVWVSSFSVCSNFLNLEIKFQQTCSAQQITSVSDKKLNLDH